MSADEWLAAPKSGLVRDGAGRVVALIGSEGLTGEQVADLAGRVARLPALEAEVAALRADAETWRAAIDDYAKGLMQGPDGTGYITRLSLAYHAAIDAARAAGEKT